MNCTNCGNSLQEGTVFCPNCGNRVDAQQPAQPAQQQSYSYGAPNGGATYGAPNSGSAPVYGSPVYSAPVQDLNAPMSLGQYMLTMLIGAIPIVGFIFLLIWAFSSDTNVNKKNYCRAVLIYMAIGIVASILFAAVLIPLIASLFSYGFSTSYTW
ncbi:MAG: zinc ribbon domain-containing protein [Bacillota bacterium]